MVVAAQPEIARILLDLGIEPVDVYAVDNAEKTYLSALIEGISTLEFANKGDSPRSRILRDEVKRLRDKKRKKVNVGKLIGKKTILPARKIKPKALLPGAETEGKEEEKIGVIKSAVDGILNILKLGNKQDKKDSKVNREERQRERRKKREGMIEGLGKGVKGAAKAGQKIVSTLVSPFQGILSAITNFLKFTFLGILINKGLAWFSSEENQKKIANFGRFLKDWWPSLLAGFALFFTPIGSLVSGVVNLLIWAIPALVRLIAANPWLGAASILMGGSIMAHNRIKKNRQSFNEQNDESITTVEEFSEENKGVPPSKRKLNLPLGQAYTEAGSFPGMMNFNSGGQVLGRPGKDKIPSMLSNNEFVVSAPAVDEFGPGLFGLLNAMGGGTNKPEVKDGMTFAEGGGFLGPMGDMWSRLRGNTWDSNGGTSSWSSVKSKGMVAVGPRPRPKNPEVIELPTKVTDLRKSKKVISGTTIPQFKITTDSPMRSLIKMNLRLEG
jgi:hypothetical protein